MFAVPDADADLIEAAAHGGALTCRHALRLHGVGCLEDEGPVHVWLGGKGRAHHAECACVVHHDAGRAGVGLAPLEEVLVHVYRCAGGITLDCQVRIPTVGRVDFVLDGRLILEADGKAHHAGSAQRHRDLVRDAVASALGYETLRFDYAQIVHAWPTVEAAVLAAIVRLRERG